MALSHNTFSENSTARRLLILSGLVAGFALRLFHLGSDSLWYDETVSVTLATKSIPVLLAHTAGDIHPPGYYLLLHGWQRLTHPTLLHGFEFLYAWPSLLAGMLVLVLLYALGRRLADRSIALLTLWLAACNPFQVWYSQEARMYTWAAVLGLLCLWALVCFLHSAVSPGGAAHIHQPRAGESRWLILYTLAGAAGLYTLYYFLFWLAGLSLIALIAFWQSHPTHQKGQPLPPAPSPRVGVAHVAPGRRSPWLAWAGAQMAMLLLWLPWLPIFLRQAIEPPVPPWRTSWRDLGAFAQDISESLSALLLGQSPPGEVTWPWALLTICLLIMYVKLWLGQVRPRSGKAVGAMWIAPLASFTPIILIYLVTLWWSPLYHVRYLFLYAPPFLLMVASVLMRLWRAAPPVGFVGVAGLLLLSGLSLQQFWNNPRYRSDDHRGAVAYLAQAWRPGDLILVNAGWAYTILQSYWPSERQSPFAATPPALMGRRRLSQLPDEFEPLLPNAPILVTSGSVEGKPSLGWGEPNSDFFAISGAETDAALARWSNSHRRVWHYRLYDTVSDPTGTIRTWLSTHARLHTEWVISGRDLGRLQLYDLSQPAEAIPLIGDVRSLGYVFDEVVRLEEVVFARGQHAGTMFYVDSEWAALPSLGQFNADLSISLRLYAGDGALLAQQDTAAALPRSRWQPGQHTHVTLAAPIPAAARPKDYRVVLVLYDAQSGHVLRTQAARSNNELVSLGDIALTSPLQMADHYTPIARFDYLELVSTQPTQASLSPGAQWQLNLVWRPRPSAYADTYLAQIELRDRFDQQVIQQWEQPLGGWGDPSAGWPANWAAFDPHQLELAPETPPGIYHVTLRLLRHHDRQVIPLQCSWWGAQEVLLISQVTVQ
jgi:uncharacterized membrane protein